MARSAADCRAFLTLLLLASWNLATSDCAFTAATTATSEKMALAQETDECPMHASKAAPQQSPQKKKGCSELPCCKNLPATAAAASFACKPTISFNNWNFSDANVYIPIKLVLRPKLCPILDTGPPGHDSFTELVLQRSIPAHAPPCA